jgi:hypothetical protein
MTYPPLASRLHGKMHRPLSLSMTRLAISAGGAVDPTLDAGGKPLMFISHDYSSAATPTGTDWDDLQDACIERLLMNQFKIVSGCTMSGANGANGIDNTENLRVSAAYATDYTAHSLASLGYPTPTEEAALMTLTGSTTLANASTGRSSASNPFIEKCIAVADANPTPYYILVTSGGGQTDFLEMFLRRPDLQPRCVFRRGSPFTPNTNYGIDPNAADYVDAQAQAGGTLANLAAVIDDQTSHRGIYITAAGANTLYDSPASPLWHQLKTRIHGSLGRLLFEYAEEIGNGPGMKNGDFPGVLYAYDQSGNIRTNSDLIDGTLQSLGGKFQAHATIAKRFIDIPSGQTLGIYPGAATVRNKGATVGGGQDYIYNTFMLNRLAQLGTQTQVRVNGTISGSARVGATLTVSAITWIGGTPDVIEYQWAWGPANSPTAIVGATSAGYSARDRRYWPHPRARRSRQADRRGLRGLGLHGGYGDRGGSIEHAGPAVFGHGRQRDGGKRAGQRHRAGLAGGRRPRTPDHPNRQPAHFHTFGMVSLGERRHGYGRGGGLRRTPTVRARRQRHGRRQRRRGDHRDLRQPVRSPASLHRAGGKQPDDRRSDQDRICGLHQRLHAHWNHAAGQLPRAGLHRLRAGCDQRRRDARQLQPRQRQHDGELGNDSRRGRRDEHRSWRKGCGGRGQRLDRYVHQRQASPHRLRDPALMPRVPLGLVGPSTHTNPAKGA